MLRILVVSNAPAPYNDALFARVAREPDVALHVLYGASREAHRAWRLDADKGYSYAVLRGWTLGGATHVNPGIFAAVRRFAPDVGVLTGSYTMPTTRAAALAFRARGVPWVYWGEELAHDPAPAPARLARAALRGLLRRAHGVLAIGSRARRSYERAGVPPARITDFRYYADTERFALPAPARAAARAALRAELGVPPDLCVLLYVGQLVARKGVDTLLRAAARVQGAGGAAGTRVVVVLAGDGPERAALVALANTLGIADAVHVLGFRQPRELPGVFAAADAFVLPSLAEGWGVVVAEAMAAGLPVLASERVNAAADLVREGANGATFPPGDDRALAHLLAALADDAKRRAAMGACARATVRAEAPAVAAPRLVRLLEATRAGEPIAAL